MSNAEETTQVLEEQEVKSLVKDLTKHTKLTFENGLWYCIPPALLLVGFYFIAAQYYMLAVQMAALEMIEKPSWWLILLMPLPIVILAVILVYATGLILRNYYGGKLLEWVTSRVERFPLLGFLYQSVKAASRAYRPECAIQVMVIDPMRKIARPAQMTAMYVHTTEGDTIKVDPVTEFDYHLNGLCTVYYPTAPIPRTGVAEMVPPYLVVKAPWRFPDWFRWNVSCGAAEIPGEMMDPLMDRMAELGLLTDDHVTSLHDYQKPMNPVERSDETNIKAGDGNPTSEDK